MLDLVRDSGDSCVLTKLDDLRAGFETASAIFDFPMREVTDEVRRIRSQAVAEIARADQDGGRSHDAMRPGSPFFWKPRSKQLEAIRNSLFFNSAHYLKTNPDVRAAGMDAAFHYLVHGGPGRPRSWAIFLNQGRRENRTVAA
jgi:hypothetical protein